MKNKRGKKAQVFGLSFGVIFSIIIIIFILVVAGIAINHFLNLKKCAQVGMFIDDFQADVDSAWNSQSSSFEFSGSLPGSLDYVCFANLSESTNAHPDIVNDIDIYRQADANLFFYPRQNACDMPYHGIKHLDLEKITETKNPYCIAVDDGKVVIKSDKGFNEALVGLS